MDNYEFWAKSIVESVVPGAVMVFHESQAHAEWDFDLQRLDGTSAALEVTSSNDSGHRRTKGAITKGGHFIESTNCKHGWLLHPRVGARIDLIRRRADELLAPIESSGLVDFFSPIHAGTNADVMRIWRELGIEAGSVTKW